MKKEIVMWLIIAVLVVGLILGTQKAETMAIDLTNTNTQGINFGAVPGVQNLANKSISFWINQDTLADGRTINLYPAGASDEVFYVDFNSIASGDLQFVTGWSTSTIGSWKIAGSTFSAGTTYKIGITYNNSSVTNDPIIYVNGVSVSVTEVITPVGTYLSGTDNDLVIGYPGVAVNTIDGKVSDARIYNRILTADEDAQIYSARGRDNIRNGLVFCPFLVGAKGLQAFDGAALAAGNTIVDPCSGAVGVPAGNPVGVGETYLR